MKVMQATHQCQVSLQIFHKYKSPDRSLTLAAENTDGGQDAPFPLNFLHLARFRGVQKLVPGSLLQRLAG